MMVDAAAGGALMRKERDETYELLEEMLRAVGGDVVE